MSVQAVHFTVPVEDSDWHFLQQPRINCQLEQTIPGLGKVVFHSAAGKHKSLTMRLNLLDKPLANLTGTLYSQAPSWKPDVQKINLGKFSILAQFDGEFSEKLSSQILKNLYQGNQALLVVNEKIEKPVFSSVMLSNVNFVQAYLDFKQCRANLLPFAFEDIAFTVLSYQSDSTRLTQDSYRRLDKIKQYLTFEPDVKLILLDGYTDSYGVRAENEQISLKRVAEIEAVFSGLGIDSERIIIDSHGETRHVASNDIDRRRALNRRVVIQLR